MKITRKQILKAIDGFCSECDENGEDCKDCPIMEIESLLRIKQERVIETKILKLP